MTATTEILDTLDTLSADILFALVERLNLPVSSTRKQDNIAALKKVLVQDVGRVLRHLSKEEQNLVAETAYNGHGQLEPQRFTAKYGIKCPLPESRPFPPSKASPLLLFFGQGYGPRAMPASIAEAVRAVLPSPSAAELTTVDHLPATYDVGGEIQPRPIQIFESERTVFPELRAVLTLAQSGKLEINAITSRPTPDAVRLVNEVLVVRDFQLDPPPDPDRPSTDPAGAVRAHAWCVILQQCKWASPKGTKLLLTDAGRAMLSSGGMPEFKRAVAELIGDDRFDELNRVEHIRGQSGRGQRHLTMPSERRFVIEAAMQDLPPNRWIEFGEAFRYAWASGHEFEVTEADDTLHLGDAQYGMLTGQSPAISRQYFRVVLFETLATLGLVDVAYVYPHFLWPELRECWGRDYYCFCSRYDGLLYIRLNALGAYCFDLTETYEVSADARGVFRALSNGEIVAAAGGEFSPSERHMLEQFAVARSAFAWQLDASKILTYLESGGSLDSVSKFLEFNSIAPIPDAVQFMLSDLSRGSSAVVTIEDAVIMEFQDPITATLVAHDPHAAQYCHLAANKRVAVPRQHLRAVRNAMRKLGIIIPDSNLAA